MDRTDQLIGEVVRETYELESLGDLLISEAREMRRAGGDVRATIERLTGGDDPDDHSDGLQDVLDTMTNAIKREIREQIDLLRDLTRSIQ
jgi:hypothetical protein